MPEAGEDVKNVAQVESMRVGVMINEGFFINVIPFLKMTTGKAIICNEKVYV
jgi:hypothetical protein